MSHYHGVSYRAVESSLTEWVQVCPVCLKYGLLRLEHSSVFPEAQVRMLGEEGPQVIICSASSLSKGVPVNVPWFLAREKLAHEHLFYTVMFLYSLSEVLKFTRHQ